MSDGRLPRLPERLFEMLARLHGPETAETTDGIDPFVRFDRFAFVAARALRACGAAVTVRGGADLCLLGLSGVPEPLRSARRLPYAESLCRRVVEARKPVVISAPHADAQMKRLAALGFHVRAYAGVPLWIGGDSVVGTLCVTSRRARRWTEAEIETLAECGATAAACIQLLLDLARLTDVRANLRELDPQLLQAQKLEVIGRFACRIAHDLNNLLHVIGGATSLALLDLPESAPGREALEEISRAVRLGSGLTRQLLAFSRQRSIEPVLIDVEEEVRSTISMLRRLCDDSIAIRADLRPVGRVRAAPSQIAQLVMNLALNARDAMPSGGDFRFELHGVHLTRAEATHLRAGLEPGAYVRLVVCDTGGGIDGPCHARVFEPFFTTKEVGAGTGLGLATVCSILRQLDGHVSLESRVGHHTRFSVYLPCATAA